jgi:protein involved in polysaccharide export with SLBB domain
MQAGRIRSNGDPSVKVRLAWALPLLAGCAAMNSNVDRALMADQGNAARSRVAAQEYRIGSPDLLEVTVQNHPAARFSKVVGPDGRINLGRLGQPRIEGLTTDEAARTIAKNAGVPESQVHVGVADYRSRTVYVIGQVVGAQRAVAYIGPETALDTLRRAGGITAGAAPEEVYVVRSRVSEGERPEVIRVDLRAILFNHDEKTNVTILPLDQIFVGETRRCAFEKAIAPWLRPVYELCCGMRGTSASPSAAPAPETSRASLAP